MKNSFDEKNPRVRLARQKRALNNLPMMVALVLIFLGLTLGGIALLIVKISAGYLLLGFAVFPVMMMFYIKNALAEILPGKTGAFTDLVDEELLLKLKTGTTPAELVKIIPQTRSGAFMMARFELSIPFLDYISGYLPASVEPIYNIAEEVRTKTNSETITGAVMVVAVIASLPNFEQALEQMKLSVDDLYQGVMWFNYLNGIVLDRKKPVHNGGLARDFAFGYTPTLEQFAINLSSRYAGASSHVQQAENEEILKQIIDTLSHEGRQNVALVGEYGSGRSTIVEYLAETLMNADNKLPQNLKYRQIYALDTTSLISAAKSRGDLEYLMVKILNEIYAAKNIILTLDNAHLFFEEGPGSIDISNLLTPILEAGKIRIIMIMETQKFLEISDKNPALANSLNKIVVHPTDEQETMKILMDQVPFIEYQKNVVFTYMALKEAWRLSNEYIHDVEMPGKAKLLLEAASPYAEGGLVTAGSVQTAVEKSYGVKVKVADSEEDRGKLLNLEQLIHERMIDQMEAVSAVANALRRAGAGVKNRNRPIGTFLFLGPTGVGKTELAKTLSEVYFDGEDNIIRLDMNEFVSDTDVARLIRNGATDGMSLTAQVMKQPFAVILLDEIEKAHPSVLTTLLQVLDEGILRDEKNREVSFRDTIIIATSNAGANEIWEYVTHNGTDNFAGFKEQLTEKLIANGEFKPEFLNRFDEICLFKPLSKEDLMQILDLIIASTNKTLAAQKISVTLTPEAKQILIERGYDPKMGARPMRRIVQKTVENIVAAAILSGAATPGTTLTISPNELNIS